MRAGSPPLVSIAIPTLNGGPLLEACIGALNRQTFRDFETLIVNNGAVPLKAGPSVRVIAPGFNTGFAAAVNLAIRQSSGEFVATLNDDTEPDPGWLEQLVAAMQADPGLGMCASRIRLFESGRLDSAGMLLCLDGSSKQRGALLPANALERAEEVFFPSACAALYRREMLEQIGLFDEDYFLYCEDTDLGLRARWGGWRCRYVPSAQVRHHYSRTAGAVSPLKARFVERNRLWVAVKNFPLFLLPVVPFAACARYLWQLASVRSGTGSASQFVGSGNSLFSAFRLLLRVHWETLKELPALLRKRADVSRRRRIGSLEFARLMFRHRISARELARA